MPHYAGHLLIPLHLRAWSLLVLCAVLRLFPFLSEGHHFPFPVPRICSFFFPRQSLRVGFFFASFAPPQWPAPLPVRAPTGWAFSVPTLSAALIRVFRDLPFSTPWPRSLCLSLAGAPCLPSLSAYQCVASFLITVGALVAHLPIVPAFTLAALFVCFHPSAFPLTVCFMLLSIVRLIWSLSRCVLVHVPWLP